MLLLTHDMYLYPYFISTMDATTRSCKYPRQCIIS